MKPVFKLVDYTDPTVCMRTTCAAELESFCKLLTEQNREWVSAKVYHPMDYCHPYDDDYVFFNTCDACKDRKLPTDHVLGTATVLNWSDFAQSGETPKPAPISADDYEKLKATLLLNGDCWVARDRDGSVWCYAEEPQKGAYRWQQQLGKFHELWKFIPSCISWQDTEPLHLTADWLKEVEHG